MILEWFEGLDGLVSSGKEGEEEALIFALGRGGEM